MSDFLKNSMRFLYLRNLSKIENNLYFYNFLYEENDDKNKDLDFFIDRKRTYYSSKDLHENKLNEIRYLYIKSNFIFRKNDKNCTLISNFSSDVKLSNYFLFEDIIDEQIKNQITNDWKSKFDIIAKLMKESFNVFDKNITDISVEKNMAIIQNRWADVGANEILLRKLNLIKSEMFEPFETIIK